MQKQQILFCIGLVLFCSTAWFNPGFLALDEYNHLIIHCIPAQLSSFHEVVQSAGFRSPFQVLPLFLTAQGAFKLGIGSPWLQYRWSLLFFGFCSYLILWFSLSKVFKKNELRLTLLTLFVFHFISSFVFTRPMFESMAAPWMALSATLFCLYGRKQKVRWALLSLFSLTLAALFRPQAGICIIVPLFVFLKRRRFNHFFLFTVCAALLFLAIGWIDQELRGTFHASLRSYLAYNIANSSSYGRRPFYDYFLLFFGLGLGPFLIARYHWDRLKENLVEAWIPIAFLFVFLIGHSAVSHKEERFMIPALPLLYIFCAPFLFQILSDVRKHKLRIALLCLVNVFLLIPTAFNVAQRNVLGLALFLDGRPDLKKIVGIDESLVLFPAVFIRTEGLQLNTAPSQILQDAHRGKFKVGCDQAIVVRSSILKQVSMLRADLQITKVFSPGFLEDFLVYLNPKKNERRGSLTLLTCRL